MKKIILTFGTAVTVAAPITAIVACGKKDKFDFTDDLAKIKDATSTKIKADLSKSVGETKDDASVTAKDLGYTAPTDLSEEVTISGYKVDTAYDRKIGKIKVEVTLTKGEETATKVITITANKEETAAVKGVIKQALADAKTDAEQAKQALADAKTDARTKINDETIPDQDDKKHKAELFSAIKTAKDNALNAITAATNVADVNTAKTEGLAALTKAIDDYNNSTGTDAEQAKQALADAKTDARTKINDETIPDQDDKKHKAELFSAIKTAKDNALNAITAATNVADVNTAKTEGLAALTKAIDDYNNSTGTDAEQAKQALADAKTDARTKINDETIPDQDDKKHKAELFSAIKTAKDNALNAITAATNVADVNTAKTEGLAALTKAIDDYNNSTGTDAEQAKQALADAKTDARTKINDETIPDQDDKKHKAELFSAIKTAKDNALNAITAATNVADVNTAKTEGLAALTKAIDDYNNSTGTDAEQAKQALADAKTDARTKINDETIPDQDDKKHKAELFSAIKTAKDNALNAITAATNVADVNTAKTEGLAALTKAIDDYNNSTGTDAEQAKQALADAKTDARTKINDETIPDQDDKKHKAELFSAIKTAKDNALNAITAATNVADVNTAKTEGLAALTKAIDDYNNSTGTDAEQAKQALADAKTDARTKINDETIPDQDDKKHKAELFSAIKTAKDNALNAITAATNVADVNTAKTEGLAALTKAIDDYNNSTGTEEAVAEELKVIAEKINDNIISNMKKDVASKLTFYKLGDDVTGQLGIQDILQDIISDNNVSLSFSVKTKYKDKGGSETIKITVTFEKDGQTETKDITVTFQDDILYDSLDEIGNNLNSTIKKSQATKLFKDKKQDDLVTGKLGLEGIQDKIKAFKDSNIIHSFALKTYDKASGIAKITVTLEKDGQSKTKDITVTFREK